MTDTDVNKLVVLAQKKADKARARAEEQGDTGQFRGKNAVKAMHDLGFPDVTPTGQLKNTCANTCVAIGKLEIVCEYDAFHDKLLVGGHRIGQYAGELGDLACLHLRRMIEKKFGFDPKREGMRDACMQLCIENQFDPICEYLDGLDWDGVDRIDEWLTTYLGAEDTPLNRAIGRIALIAQVRRARQPGCKFDQIIVLEGKEGKNKSTALTVLAGGNENFSDQTILGRGDKEQQELLRGVWVYEIADLTNIARTEVESVKAFASRTHDRARPAYGHYLVALARRCVIWATTNNKEYLKSQTGNRRFWPILVAVARPIDIESLKRDRDQLFAEAAHYEAMGASSVLPENLWDAAAIEQEQRREADPWEDVLVHARGTFTENEDKETRAIEERISSQDLLSKYLNIPIEKQVQSHLKRLSDVMGRLGWEGPKPMREKGKLYRGYCRPPPKEGKQQ
jgi:predicted P-loop ATPase